MRLRELQAQAFNASKAKGFHSTEKLDEWKALALLHTEVSEAIEEVRKPDYEPTRTYYREDGKPEGLPSELADVLIRVCDTAGALGIDLETAISEKMAFNATRPPRHGGKRA